LLRPRGGNDEPSSAGIIEAAVCGPAKAKYYLLLRDQVLDEEAERIGLISLGITP
jgi:enoyl-CoA hydratase/carnithine racemase